MMLSWINPGAKNTDVGTTGLGVGAKGINLEGGGFGVWDNEAGFGATGLGLGAKKSVIEVPDLKLEPLEKISERMDLVQELKKHIAEL